MVRANGLEACYLRPIAFYGSEKMGVSPMGAKVHVAIAAWPWGAYLGPDAIEKGIRVKTSSFARHHVNVTMCRAKIVGHLCELDPRQPRGDRSTATTRGCCSTSTASSPKGAGENIFIVKNGRLYEPELTSRADRHHPRPVITLARDLGLRR